MPLYRCNSDTGSQITGGGVVKFGAEFSVSSSEPPRSAWIPLDDAAHAVFAKWNREHPNAQIHPRKDKLPQPKVSTDLEIADAALAAAIAAREQALSIANDAASLAKRRAQELAKANLVQSNNEESLSAQAQLENAKKPRGRAADGG
jgi:hypothetical protein